MSRRAEVLDAYVTGGFQLPDFLGGRFLNLKIGDQVLNWGESTFLLPNSLSSTNPLDTARLRLPGFQVAELFKPTGLVTASTNLTTNISAEVFYNYEWDPFTIDPPGSFFSTLDGVGAPITGTDDEFLMLSFGKAPEDPDRIYNSANNPDDTAGLLTSSSRTLLVGDPITPKDSGQYGIRLNYFADWIGAGTDISLYFMNLHARLPRVSAFAAQATCIGPNTTELSPDANLIPTLLGGGMPTADALSGGVAADCGLGQGDGSSDGVNSHGRLNFAQDPAPIDSVTPVLHFPEDIKIYGFSWNTTVFDWAFSGEYAFRPDMPLQLNAVDLVFAALQPAFPRNNIVAADGGGGGQNVILGSRRANVPDFIESVHRAGRTQDNPSFDSVQGRQFIPGFEERAYGKFDMTLLRTIGGTNPLGASRLLLLFEWGFTHVDTPSLGQFQLAEAGIGTHISDGADGTEGIVDAFVATGPNNAAGDVASETTDRQNPTSGTTAIDGLYDSFSTGYRLFILPTYESLFWNINVSPELFIFHDVYGTTPGPAGSHVEDRLQVLAGVRWDYLSTFSGGIRYSGIYDLGGEASEFVGDRDRDTLSMFVRYEF